MDFVEYVFLQNPPAVTSDDAMPPYAFLFISEINMDTTSCPPKRYIELHVEHNPSRSIPPFKNRLEGWRLVLVKGTTMEMILSIDISAHTSHHPGNKLVIGDNMVPNVNIALQDEKTEICKHNCDLDLDSSPYAIILIVSMNVVTHDMFSLPKENGKFQSVSLLDDHVKQEMFFKYTYDIAVIGRKVRTNQCDFFTRLFPNIERSSGFMYLLRDRDSPTASVDDYSLNYCCRDFIPYSPECFKLGHPSPGNTRSKHAVLLINNFAFLSSLGRENDCTGKRFILEMELGSIQKARMSSLFVDVNNPLCKADFPGVPPYRYAAVHDHDYAAAVARVMQSTESCTKNDQYMEIDQNQEDFLDRHPRPMEMDDDDGNEPRKYVPDFDLQSFQNCQHHFSNPEDLLQRQYTSWMDFDSEDCRITCRVCRTYFQNGWRPDKKHKFYLQEDGFLSKNKYINKKMVKDHLIDNIHLEAAHFLGSLDSALSRKEQRNLEGLQVLAEKKRLQPTMNEVSLAYIELRARVSFRSHKLFMDGVSKLNVNVGFKHRSEDSLHLICTTLSESFHVKLLRFLVKSDTFFSLICDGTTNRSVLYLVCLIQTIEEKRPIVYFWGLIVITTGESGYNMVEDLKIRIIEDDEKVPGFQEFFKRRIIAVVSDSASNMVGISNSFYTHLMEYTGRDLALVKCGAHKLQRAIIHAIDFPTDSPSPSEPIRTRSRYFKSFAKINNQFYSFYMSRGSKRFQEFVELAEELDLHAYRINYFFDVRWAASHKRCMETMYNNYDALYADLDRITKDNDIDQAAQNKARELFKHLTDKTFAVVIAEFVDMLTIFKTMSERFQSKGGIMAGNVEIIRDGYQDIKFLQTHLGAFLKKFLNTCSCEDVCEEGSCSLKQYDDCAEVTRSSSQKLKARQDGSHTIHLSAHRHQLYENLLQQLIHYFDPTTLEAFEIFNPKYLNDRCVTSSESGTTFQAYYTEFQSIVPNAGTKSVEDRMKTICLFYGLGDCEAQTKEWKSFLHILTQDSSAMRIRSSDPSKFWSAVLESTSIQIAPMVQDLIKRVLSTSFISADAERAFSMVSNIKTPDRSSLSPSTLENLVRIAFNVPESLSEESIFEYTKDFVKVSSRVDDPSFVGGRQSKPEAFKRYFSKSRLF